MSVKTIFIITVSVLVTIVLMKNTDEVAFWVFGDAQIPKLAILGIMFALGFLVGYLAVRPGKNKDIPLVEKNDEIDPIAENRNSLTDEDRDYIT